MQVRRVVPNSKSEMPGSRKRTGKRTRIAKPGAMPGEECKGCRDPETPGRRTQDERQDSRMKPPSSGARTTWIEKLNPPRSPRILRARSRREDHPPRPGPGPGHGGDDQGQYPGPDTQSDDRSAHSMNGPALWIECQGCSGARRILHGNMIWLMEVVMRMGSHHLAPTPLGPVERLHVLDE